MWMPSTNKDRKSPLRITEVHGCACKGQAVYTAAPHTLQHTSVLSEAEDTEGELRTRGNHHEDAPPFSQQERESAHAWSGSEAGKFEEEADFELCLDQKS